MAFECKERSWRFGETTVKQVSIGAKVTKHYGVEVTFLTPNIIEVTEPWETALYVRGDIRPFSGKRNFLDRVLGRERIYSWIEGDLAEDQSFQEKEREILRHPFVGREMALYYGDVREGIYIDLLKRGYRVEVRHYPLTQERFFLTTNEVWTKVEVIDGKRGNVFNNHRFQQELKVILKEGMYKGTELGVSPYDLRVGVNKRNKAVVAILEKRANGEQLTESEEQLEELQQLLTNAEFDSLSLLRALYFRGIVLLGTYPATYLSSRQLDRVLKRFKNMGIDPSNGINPKLKYDIQNFDPSDPFVGASLLAV